MDTEQNNALPYLPPSVYLEDVHTCKVIAISNDPYPHEEDLY